MQTFILHRSHRCALRALSGTIPGDSGAKVPTLDQIKIALEGNV